jgi:Putative porin
VVKEKDFVAFKQLAGWAASTAFTGDMRVREENIDVEGEPDFTGSRDKDRQRIRARLGAFSQINPEVKTGIQVASGNGADRRSTNENLDNYFDKKAVWLDLAYINYLPSQVVGLSTFAGKMKQPWMALGDVIWDSDINPEGIAGVYTKKNGTTTFFGSGGYYVLKDAVDSEGYEFSHDLALYHAQLGMAFDPTDSVRLTLGGSVYDYNKDRYGSTSSFRANGNTTDKFGLGELFTQIDVIGLPLPLSLYGQFVQNYDARDVAATKNFDDADEDTAYLFGLRTNLGGVAVDYNYRDVEANAVVGGMTDSDFAVGYTNSSGHKLKLKYDIMKNFAIGATYFMAESDAVSSRKLLDVDADTLHIDLEAKF